MEQTGESSVLEQLRLIANSLVQKADQTEVEADSATNIKEIAFDGDTGVFTFTRSNGTSITFDTALEKVPASFDLVEENDGTYLKITNVDGSFTKTDVTRLLNVYTFFDSDTVRVDADGYHITPSVKEGSIKEIHLDSDILKRIHADESTVIVLASEVKEAADAVKQSEINVKTSEAAAAAAAEKASSSEKNSYDYSLLSESYAKGGTGIRDGEDTDNAKYYMEHAAAYASGDGVSVFIQSDEPSVKNCIWIKPLNESLLTTGTVMLELSDDLGSSNYYAEIDGNLKAIENIVDSDSELTDGNYRLNIT